MKETINYYEILKSNPMKLVLIIILILAGGYMYFGHQDRIHHLNGDVEYTIGEITDFQWGSKASPYFKFYFFVNGEKILGRYDITDDFGTKVTNELAKRYFGKTYFVKYSVEKAKYHELYFYNVVPDSIKDCFECSWLEKPF
ncbi:hypothetical protein Q2T40_13045 [Winogradskyella maritima]|uniref:Uncharacterized protein n=1 Tax=Winogradskyella maritima TaxID=1517766 RepID=A0ABV8AGW3_9FLAO|nr:hypothetical protein [Winogradskyella maritima]